LTDDQIAILRHGRTCGAIEFNQILQDNGCTGGVILAEVETFVYASRSDGSAEARLLRINAPPTVNHCSIFEGVCMRLMLIASLPE
jgi:hypothetical protein